MKPNIIEKHNGCPNKDNCEKDDTKCCYLNKENQCIIKQRRYEK